MNPHMLLGLMRSYRLGSWAEQAACRRPGVDPDWFFPTVEGRNNAVRALAVCRACPVRVACADWVLSAPIAEHGVWGGMTEPERKPLRRAIKAERLKTVGVAGQW